MDHSNIYVLDGLNGVIDIVDVYESVIWNVQFFGVSDFELKVVGNKKNLTKLAVGRFLVRGADMDNDTYKNVMIIEELKLDFDIEKGWTLTVSGGGLKKLLKRRIVWQQTNLTGTVETGIRQVITDNVISPTNTARAIPNFTLDNSQGYEETFDIQLLGENIAEWLESTCQTYGYGWDVYISGGKFIFTLKKGTDRTYDQTTNIPVVFSPEYDNLISSTYDYNLVDYKNAALIGGEGEGTEQRTATIGDTSGLERFESYIDGSSVSSNGEIITLDTYMKMLQDYGQEQISQSSFTESFEGSVIPNGMYEYGVDYFLGDLVQIVNEHGLEGTSRVTEIIYSEDENGWALTPTFKNQTDESEG